MDNKELLNEFIESLKENGVIVKDEISYEDIATFMLNKYSELFVEYRRINNAFEVLNESYNEKLYLITKHNEETAILERKLNEREKQLKDFIEKLYACKANLKHFEDAMAQYKKTTVNINI